MNFTCSKNKILNAINIVSKAVSSKSTMNLQECILITAEDEGFKLLANDLEMCIESSIIICDVKETGSIALDARIFSEIIKKLPDDNINICTDEKFVTVIKSGRSEFKILGLSGEDFSVLPIVEKNNKYVIASHDLKDMIKKTIFSVAIENSKIALTGELIDIKNNNINIVAVDGFRVSVRTNPLKSIGEDISVVIPAKTMNEISKILPIENESKVNMYFTEKHALFELDTCIVVSRIIDGEFMKYEQVFSDDYDTIIFANKMDLIASLERSSIISQDNKKNPVKLKIEKKTIEITSNNEMGTTYDELTIEMNGDPIEIAFNPKYLIDALKAIDEEKISIQFTTPLSPCMLRAVSKDSHKYLILPLRLRG